MPPTANLLGVVLPRHVEPSVLISSTRLSCEPRTEGYETHRPVTAVARGRWHSFQESDEIDAEGYFMAVFEAEREGCAVVRWIFARGLK